MIRICIAALGFLSAAGTSSADEFFTLKGHGGPVMSLAVAPDTGQIASASFDNAVGLWQSRIPRWFDGHRAAVNAVAFAGPDRLVSGGDDFRVLLWSAEDGTPKELVQHQGKVAGLAVSPDGNLVASASWDGTIGLTDLRNGESHLLKGHEAGVNAVAFATNGALYSASADGTLRLWDTASGSEKRLVLRHGFGINRLALNRDEGWLAYGAVDGVTRVLDLETDQQIADFTLDRRPILAMSFNPATARLAVGDGEGYIMVVDTDIWKIVRDFRATGRGPVWALAFSPDGSNIHAAGLDPVVYSWPLETLDAHEPMTGADRPYLRDPAQMENGERQFARKCSICHSLTPGSARRAGPTLHGLFGRASGSVPDYSYSETLQRGDIVWSETTIDALFDEGPDHYIPGSKMPMQRIAAQTDRADLIDYLRRATASNGDE
ncbi:c-type cytochrome [Meridianimarinicoccus aquatilis]|uniref:C-type cytochrome n=1 Tax=Meridianimarinicoccus aquatilis TaxID=2552766 RepID=A0A4R6B1N7_9RHOB|nr:c-type cytochrome [Fluviibacterium aquatile]TDL90577.1 c-type cytochrome [Fluviibacterium aquatile]